MKQNRLATVCAVMLQAVIFSTFGFPAAESFSAVYHVTGDGTRASGTSEPDNWASSNCYRTIRAAVDRMGPGDEVIVNDGTYSGSSNSIGGMPSGSPEKYTVVRARNPFQVTIDSGLNTDSSWNYNARLVSISGQYVQVDGFKLRQRDSSNNYATSISGDYIKLTRCLLRIEGAMNNEMWGLAIQAGASYILVEDCAFVGGFRYMVGIVGIGGVASQVVFRRVVARGDWTTTDEPYSLFAVYGNDSTSANGPHHIYYQNCIALDTNMIQGSNTWKHVPWYIFKGNHDIMLEGCITLSNQVPYYFFFRNDYGGYNMEIKNSVFAGNQGSTTTATFRGSNSTSGYDRVSGCTFYGQPRGLTWSGTTTNGYIKNNLFLNLANSSISFSGSYPSRSFNSFSNSGQQFGTNTVPYSNDTLYLPRVESGSNRYGGGEGGANVGAHIVRRIGVSGTLYGQTGWDTTTNEDLWPWPYESHIREWFRAAAEPPAGASPSTNNTQRGFCGEGQSLTKYIWGYLGNGLPPDFSTGSAPARPSNMRAIEIISNSGG